MKFSDALYGEYETPDWLDPFLTIPEFLRLRGVRLSNVDSIEFKDFSGANRWEHCIAVAYLALQYSKFKKLSLTDTVHLTLAALLHDIATPPFAHTVEYVLESFNHELESNRLIQQSYSEDSFPSISVFASQTPQFVKTCQNISKKLKIKIDPEEVANIITGDGKLGFLINGSIDLDNIDNVTRASMLMGIDIDKNTPLNLVKWLCEFDNVPIGIHESENTWVKNWIKYKYEMYSKFYDSSDIEIGRQAFLQHLIRRVYREGLSRQNIIWKTDDELLNIIESYDNHQEVGVLKSSLQELVQRYRLLEPTEKLFSYELNEDEHRTLKNPLAASWIENIISSNGLELFVIVKSKRFYQSNSLFNTGTGSIDLFKLGKSNLSYSQLPGVIKNALDLKDKERFSIAHLRKSLRKLIIEWINERPWQELNADRTLNLKSNLDNVGNWSFRLSRNRSLHAYPATFVHTIPATLINCLGLRGELIVDTFGGTGNTAIEAIKQDSQVYSIDINKIASLIAEVRLNYLNSSQRKILFEVSRNDVDSMKKSGIPDVKNINKWHNTKTLDELRKIKTHIYSFNDEKIVKFLEVCFSSILTSTTARKGKQHGFFADNTPLAKGETEPPYEPAINLYLDKIKKNLEILIKLYTSFERQGKNPSNELSKATVLNTNITELNLKECGINKNSVSAIITSPPYLCMVDYTLGQRLSYYWLFPNELDTNFEFEIGSRRTRTNPEKAEKEYFKNINKFAQKSSEMLRSGGFLCTVIGVPQAKAFVDRNIMEKIDSIFKNNGFELFWEINRPINWHRNHSYSSLKEERVAVHVKKVVTETSDLIKF